MACVCFNQETVTYHGLDAARNGKPDGSELVLCAWCEGVISKVPTTRERLYREGRLPWQSWPDRAHSVREPLEDLDQFAVAYAAVLPAAFPILDGDDGGPIVESELSGMFSRDGGSGIEAS